MKSGVKKNELLGGGFSKIYFRLRTACHPLHVIWFIDFLGLEFLDDTKQLDVEIMVLVLCSTLYYPVDRTSVWICHAD